MFCEICGKDPIEILILPIKQPNGSFITLACLECAKKTSAYCVKHDWVHSGFADGTTACLICIEEIVSNTDTYTQDSYWNRLGEKLPDKESTRLWQWAHTSSWIARQREETCIVRALATKALRTGRTVEEMIDQLIADQSVSAILPPGFEPDD